MEPRFPFDTSARDYDARGSDDNRKKGHDIGQKKPGRFSSVPTKDGAEPRNEDSFNVDSQPTRSTSETDYETVDERKDASNLHKALDLARKAADSSPVSDNIRELISADSDNRLAYITISVEWDVKQFIDEELEGNRDLLSTLTLSGTAERAFATTCRDYIHRFWPEYQDFELAKIFREIGHSEEFGDEKKCFRLNWRKSEPLEIYVRISQADRSYRRFEVCGTNENLIRFAQLLTWIAAVFRPPRRGQLSYSSPVFEMTGRNEYSIRLLDLERVSDGLCWSPMFTNGVIAKGFPIPERQNEVGLEIPFDVMLVLGRIWYPIEYLDGFVLKGYSTILVPTAKTLESIQWHFISSGDPGIRIGMSAVARSCESVVENVDLKTIQTARTFVGWTRARTVHAGAKTSGFESICDSESSDAPRRPHIANETTPSIATSGLGFFGITLGAKIIIPKSIYGPVKREHILLEDMLLNSRDNSLLLWDAATMRGWMVSELTILLMLLHVWASRQSDSEKLLAKIPFIQPCSDDAKASYNAIRAYRNIQLRSQDSGDGENLEFMMQVRNIFAALESRREEIITRRNTSTSALASAMFSRSTYLKGWEMIDIAHSRPWFKEKRLSLDDTCGSWPSLLEKQSDVLVLFCRGVGDLIQPSSGESFCQAWESVPKGRSYVAATVAGIQNLNKLGIQCQAAEGFKVCTFDGKDCPSRLHEMNDKLSSRTHPLPSTGAVIIGKPPRGQRQACLPSAKRLQDRTRKDTLGKGAVEEKPNVTANGESAHSLSGSLGKRKGVYLAQDHDSGVQTKVGRFGSME